MPQNAAFAPRGTGVSRTHTTGRPDTQRFNTICSEPRNDQHIGARHRIGRCVKGGLKLGIADGVKCSPFAASMAQYHRNWCHRPPNCGKDRPQGTGRPKSRNVKASNRFSNDKTARGITTRKSDFSSQFLCRQKRQSPHDNWNISSQRPRKLHHIKAIGRHRINQILLGNLGCIIDITVGKVICQGPCLR